MKQTLDVYLYENLTGHLYQDEHGQTLFQYAEDYLKLSVATPLSMSLPLKQDVYGEKNCKPFFSGVLPDEAKRKIIARNLGVSANNDFAMLEQIGGECAGAVTFVSAGVPLSDQNNNYKPLTQGALENILRELPRRPLMAGDEGVRLSLAGAQDKIAVYKHDDDLFLPLENAPTSHIVKPDVEEYRGLIFNEAFCMKLAASMDLQVAPVATAYAGKIAYLIIERYDRLKNDNDGKPRLERIHQEDFCQAMGIVPDRKYQIEGGPSLRDCFMFLRESSTVPSVDLVRLLDAVIFNFLIGNHDAHGKNFSLLYRRPGAGHAGKIRLAPLYDLICTAIYPPMSKRLAMNIGSAHELSQVDQLQLDKLATQIEFSKPLVKEKLVNHARKMTDLLNTIQVDHAVGNEVRTFIASHCRAVLKHFTK